MSGSPCGGGGGGHEGREPRGESGERSRNSRAHTTGTHARTAAGFKGGRRGALEGKWMVMTPARNDDGGGRCVAQASSPAAHEAWGGGVGPRLQCGALYKLRRGPRRAPPRGRAHGRCGKTRTGCPKPRADSAEPGEQAGAGRPAGCKAAEACWPLHSAPASMRCNKDPAATLRQRCSTPAWPQTLQHMPSLLRYARHGMAVNLFCCKAARPPTLRAAASLLGLSDRSSTPWRCPSPPCSRPSTTASTLCCTRKPSRGLPPCGCSAAGPPDGCCCLSLRAFLPPLERQRRTGGAQCMSAKAHGTCVPPPKQAGTASNAHHQRDDTAPVCVQP